MIRSKLTRLADGVVQSSPSPRVVVIFDNSHGAQHAIGYLGFSDAIAADTCYHWLLARCGKYDRKANSGVCKPRKAKRVGGCAWEIKLHQPPTDVLQAAIQKDLARLAVAVAA